MTRPLANWRGLGKLRSAISSSHHLAAGVNRGHWGGWNGIFMRDFPQNTSIRSKLSFEGESWQKYFYAGDCIVCPAGCISWIFAFKPNICLIIISWSWSLNLPCPNIVRPSANVTNCRPIAPPYNNFAPYFSQYFVGTCHSRHWPWLCWHSFRDSKNSSVQLKFGFRLKKSAPDLGGLGWRQTVSVSKAQKLTESTSFSNLVQFFLDLKYKTFQRSTKHQLKF